MGGEGSMMAANNSLKNNRSLVVKRKDKQALSGSYEGIELKDFPKATESDLHDIQRKIKLQNKNMQQRQILIFVILVVVICVAAVFWL